MTVVQTLDIGEVSAHSGLRPSTLRFYEEKGLIRSVGRNGLRRVFDTEVLDRLSFIALGTQAGFSLDEISEMLTADGRLQIDRARLVEKASELDDIITRLQFMRDGLRHAAQCSAPSHMECPKFQRLLRLAYKTRARKKKQ